MLVFDAGMHHVPVVQIAVDLALHGLAAQPDPVAGGGVPVALAGLAHLHQLHVVQVEVPGVDQIGVDGEQLGVEVVVSQHLGGDVGDAEGDLVVQPGPVLVDDQHSQAVLDRGVELAQVEGQVVLQPGGSHVHSLLGQLGEGPIGGQGRQGGGLAELDAGVQAVGIAGGGSEQDEQGMGTRGTDHFHRQCRRK